MGPTADDLSQSTIRVLEQLDPSTASGLLSAAVTEAEPLEAALDGQHLSIQLVSGAGIRNTWMD